MIMRAKNRWCVYYTGAPNQDALSTPALRAIWFGGANRLSRLVAAAATPAHVPPSVRMLWRETVATICSVRGGTVPSANRCVPVDRSAHVQHQSGRQVFGETTAD